MAILLACLADAYQHHGTPTGVKIGYLPPGGGVMSRGEPSNASEDLPASNGHMRHLDTIACAAQSIISVLALPMRDRSLGTRLLAFAAIVLGAPTVVCGTRVALARLSQHRERASA